MPVRAVFFDFDGVLADTENLHVTAWERTFGRMGWEVDAALCARAAEEDDQEFLQSIFSERQIPEGRGDLEGYARIKQDWMRQLIADGPRIYPGVPELVERLQARGVRLAVITTTWRENVETALKGSGLRDAFELIISKEAGAAPKPAPDLYRIALEVFHLKPVSAVVVEDSPAGLESAFRAGLASIAVGHGRDEGDWSRQATAFLPDLRDPAAFFQACKLQFKD